MDPKAIKTLWKEKGAKPWKFFCPLCKAERTLAAKPEPDMERVVLQVAATAAFFTLVTWPWLSWKGIVSFIPFWMVYELYHRVKVRAQVPCPHCGFDPFLVMVDVKRARNEVENHWRKVFAEKGIPYPEKPGRGRPAPKEAPAVSAESPQNPT